MNEHLSLAMKVRDICLKNKVEWRIKINGMVEIEAVKNISKKEGFYYKLEGKVSGEDDLEGLDYRLRYKKAPE